VPTPERNRLSTVRGKTPLPGNREWTPLARALAAASDHWTLAIAFELASGRMRLAQLHRRMPAVSTGVLDRHLTNMVALGLLTRERFREMPPRVELELTDSGRELVPIACALARWGMRHVWSDPGAGELVDVSALMRMLPTLLEDESDIPEGSIEAIIEDPTEPVHHVFRVQDGRLRHLERENSSDGANGSTDTHARVRGAGAAWIAALGPEADLDRLEISGDADLARRVFTALPRAARSTS